MIFYFVFFLIAIILSIKIPIKMEVNSSDGTIFYKRINHWSVLFIFVTLIIGLRYQVGTDYMSYVEYFWRYQSGFRFPNVELGYELLNKAVILVGLDYWAVFLVCAALTNFLVLKTLKEESNHFLLSVVILFGIGFFFRQTNQVRQIVAVAFSFYAVKYIINRNFKKYMLFCILAILFHITAIFMIPIYWLANVTWKKSIIIFFCIIALIAFILPTISINLIMFLGDYVVPPAYSHYIQRTLSAEGYIGSGLKILGETLILIIISFILPKNIMYSQKGRVYYNLYIYGFIAQAFLSRFWALHRLSVYLLMYQTLFIPYVIYHLKTNKYLKMIILMFIFSYYILLTFMAIKGNSHDIIPYQMIFNL